MTRKANPTAAFGRLPVLLVLAALPALLLGWAVYRQGLNLLDDGLWLLGADLVSGGGVLYRDLFSIYGPARYDLLAGFFLLAGRNVLALALLKAVCDAAAAAGTLLLARRLGAGRWAWLAPVGVVALGPVLPRYVFLLLLALLALRCFAGDWRVRGRYLLGVVWGATALFGLDALIYSCVVMAGGALLGSGREGLRRLVVPAVGLATVLGVALVLAAVRGALPDMWWDTVVYPLTRFRSEMGVPWWQSFQNGGEMHLPFAGLHTGEKLPAAWPGHVGMRALGLRALYLGLGLVPAVALWHLRGLREDADRRLAWGFAVALALTGWLTILGRGDTAHLRLAWLGSVALAAGLAASGPVARTLRLPVILCLLVIGCGPLLGEKLWLATHTGRDGLVFWERPRARILVAKSRREGLEAVFRRLPEGVLRDRRPVLFWPALPGLHFLSDLPLPTAQATLLAGEARDPEDLAGRLAARPPAAFVAGPPATANSGPATPRREARAAWDFLRANYRVAVTLSAGEDNFRLGYPLPPGGPPLTRVALDNLFPDLEQGMIGTVTPPLEPGRNVGQSFTAGGLGLQGVAVMWVVEPFAPGNEFPVRISVWGRREVGGPFDDLLGQGTQTVRLERANERSYYVLRQVQATPGREVAVTFELLEKREFDVGLALLPVENLDGRRLDALPEGTAMMGGYALDADLYIYTY